MLKAAGSNETGTVLLLLIILVWFLNSPRFTALKKVITSPFDEVTAPVQVASSGGGGGTQVSGEVSTPSNVG